MTVDLCILRRLELKATIGWFCRRCRVDVRPRRLWRCRGLSVEHVGLCLNCVRLVALKWKDWIDWILEPRPIGVLGGME